MGRDGWFRFGGTQAVTIGKPPSEALSAGGAGEDSRCWWALVGVLWAPWSRTCLTKTT